MLRQCIFNLVADRFKTRPSSGVAVLIVQEGPVASLKGQVAKELADQGQGG